MTKDNMPSLAAFRPLPPIRKNETLYLNYDDVQRINNTFVEYVRKLEQFSAPQVTPADKAEGEETSISRENALEWTYSNQEFAGLAEIFPHTAKTIRAALADQGKVDVEALKDLVIKTADEEGKPANGDNYTIFIEWVIDHLDSTGRLNVEPKRHRWDRDGERCLDCGDKDWINDPVCTPPKPDHTEALREALDAIENEKLADNETLEKYKNGKKHFKVSNKSWNAALDKAITTLKTLLGEEG